MTYTRLIQSIIMRQGPINNQPQCARKDAAQICVMVQLRVALCPHQFKQAIGKKKLVGCETSNSTCERQVQLPTPPAASIKTYCRFSVFLWTLRLGTQQYQKCTQQLQ